MDKTHSAQRRRDIVAYTRAEGQIPVTELAERLGVAPETIRRDLTVLEQQGLVRRIHGAVHPLDGAGFESTMEFRSKHMVPEKKRIADAAAERVGPAQSLYLDEGFTPQLIADRLIRISRPLTVVTPSLPVAASLAAAQGISVILLGGNVRGPTLGTTGHWVTEMLSNLLLDLAILGTTGISVERGLTTPDPATSAIKTKVIQISRRRIFVGVNTKFGVNSFARFADISDFEALITDKGLGNGDIRRYSTLGPELVRV